MDIVTERHQQLLDFIIKEYVKTARPVGSVLVAQKGKFDLSPATLRNEMYELEEDGYLEQLHTSGGRVPTDKAYRYFVNKLIKEEEFSPAFDEKRKINQAIRDSDADPREINKNIAQVLSDLSDNLVITGISNEDEFYKIGLSSLFDAPEFRELDKIFRMTSFFDEFDRIFSGIEQEFFGESDRQYFVDDFNSKPRIENSPRPPALYRINIFIGKENSVGQVKDETLICAKYYLPHNYIGSLTMVGPKRMDYEKNIALIKYATEEVNKISNGQ